jgi:hypothetical protein
MKTLFSLLILTIFLFADSAWACPGCAGSMDNSKYESTVYILMAFIGLTYIPFFILYKTVWKYRKGVLPNQPISK